MMFIHLSTLHSDENLKARGPIDQTQSHLVDNPLVVFETRNMIACRLCSLKSRIGFYWIVVYMMVYVS